MVNQEPLGPVYSLSPMKFSSKGYLYINNQDGTFHWNRLESSCARSRPASMGADIADINGDGIIGIFSSTDMLPDPPTRLKASHTFEIGYKVQFNKTHGYHYQFSRNMLHVNNWRRTFSENGSDCSNVRGNRLEAGGALLFDMEQ